MTGPHLLAAVAYDEYYRDTPRMIGDFGKLLHQNLKRLAEAGCRHIQIDEPYFTMAADDEVRTAVDAINTAIEGLPNDMHIMMHICQGNYAVGPDYDGQIGHRYFDQGKWSPSASEGDAWLPTPLWCCSRCSEGRTIASPRSVAERTLPQRDSGRIE